MHSGDRTTHFRAFVHELRRREVFQTAGLYAVGAFLVTEIALAFIDRSPLPESTQALAGCLLVSLFVGGFPAVLWLAWLFDLTRHGIVRERSWARGRSVTAYAALATVIVGTGLALWTLNPCGFGRVIGIAILPCSYNGDAEYNYQARGISAELNYRLSHLPQLHVPANTAVAHFSDRLVSPDELAHELGIEQLIECSLRRDDARIFFNLRLYAPENDDDQWADEYAGQAADELYLIAEAVNDLIGADALKIAALAGARVDEINSMPTLSHDAWRLFQSAASAETESNPDRALTAYRKAAVIDPAFSRAHTSAARLLWLASLSPELKQSDATAMLGAAQAHIRRALQEPHIDAETLMLQRVLIDSGDEPDLLHAEIIARRPSFADEFLLWSAWLARNNRVAEAEAALARAQELDPSGNTQKLYHAILSSSE